MADIGSLTLLALVGTWAALDGTSVGQFLIARPLVSATLSGWVLGDIGSGLLVGMLLEGTYVGDVPAGGARFPEPGPAAVGATLAFIRLGDGGGLAASLLLGVIMGAAGGLSVVALRHLNGWIVTRPGPGGTGHSGTALAHWTCLAADCLRGAALSLVGIALALAVPASLAALWEISLPTSIGLFVLPSLLSGGALLKYWARSWRRRILFAAGCAGGLALAVAA